MKSDDLKTTAFVLRRTNLGEADRLVDFLTPKGRVLAMARASRREKSRLAGGIELFCLSEIQIHHSPTNDRNTLTSAKMHTFYRHILEDLDRLELASRSLKEVEFASRDADSPAYFQLLHQLLAFLDTRPDNLILASLWFQLNLEQERGNELNLIFDTDGQPLSPNLQYSWDANNDALHAGAGPITANHIKLLRLILTSPLQLVSKVNQIDQLLPEIIHITTAHRQK